MTDHNHKKKKGERYREVALALHFILDHQQLDVDAKAAFEQARRCLFDLEAGGQPHNLTHPANRQGHSEKP